MLGLSIKASLRKQLPRVLVPVAILSACMPSAAAPPEPPRAAAGSDQSIFEFTFPRDRTVREWAGDCRPDSGVMKVPSRLVPLSADFTPAEEPWRIDLSDLNETSPLVAHAGDFDGDGMSDIIAGVPGTRILFIGFSTGRGFRRHPLQSDGALPRSFAYTLILDGDPGSCARAMIPPDAPGAAFRLIGWREIKGLPSDQKAPALRAFEQSRFYLWNDRRSHLLLGETDRQIDRSQHSAFNPGIGWFQYDSEPFPFGGEWLGFGYPLSSKPRLAIVTTLSPNRSIRAVKAVGVDTDVLVSVLPLYDEMLSRTLMGDFNGDSLTDFIYLREHSSDRVAWLSQTFVDTPLSLPLAGLTETIGAKRVLTSGDFDGDGTDELLLAGAGTKLSIVRLLRTALPPKSVRVTIDGKPAAVDSQGRFLLELEVGRRRKVLIESEQYEISHRAMSLTSDRSGWDRMGIQLRSKEIAAEAPQYSGFFLDTGPFVCTGWNRGFDAFQVFPHMPYRQPHHCPPGFALMEVDDGNIGGGSCCELPRGMLKPGTEITTRDTICPANHVATGIARFPELVRTHCPEDDCEQILLCTAIDETRYRLTEDVKGKYWGDGTARLYGTHQQSRSEIPYGLRNGIGRQSFHRWDMDGCAPPTWGSVFRGGWSKRANECDRYYYARIVPLDEGTDPSSPTWQWQKNPIFPIRNCAEPTDPGNPFRGCKVAR